ncbi:MAG: hypothetical protein KBA81_02235 [Rhabdochlamydiaceae bacterium]|nr:hypothetical protein [Rhabdochlamydiaceae bacterium]
MSLNTILEYAYDMLSMPYNYYYGPTQTVEEGSQSDLNINVEEWVVVKTQAEETQEEIKQINQIADKVFAPKVSSKTIYSYDQLKNSGRREEGALIPFSQYSSQNPYLRRSNIVPTLYNASPAYQADMAEKIIDKYLGRGNKSPVMHLREQLEKRNPEALKVAAALHQLGNDSSCLPTESEHAEEFLTLLGKIHVVPVEKGTIEMGSEKDSELSFTIKGDLVAITSTEGDTIALYRMERSVTIGYPKEDQSVSCKIDTVYRKVQTASIE